LGIRRRRGHTPDDLPDALGSSSRISAAIFGSRVLGLVRESVFAALFGAGAVADAYQVAFRVPNLLRDLFAEGALSSAFVPTFTAALNDDGRARAHALADLAMSGLLVVTGLITGLALWFAEPIVLLMTSGFAGDTAKLALAVELTRTMLPILVLVSLAAVWMGMLNAQRRFVVPALAPALFNAVSIAVGVGLWIAGLPILDAVLAWSLGTVAGGAVQAGVQLVALVRMGYRPRPRLQGLFSDPGVRRIARLMAPAVIGIAAVNVNVFVNTRFASELGDGPVAQLQYAFRLFFLPLGVFGVALATVTTTSVSEEAARGDRTALAARTRDGVTAAWMLTTASAVGLALLAEPIVRLIYRHGATTVDDARAIAVVLQAYVIGLAPYALVKILAPGFYTSDRARIPMFASIAGVIVNLSFNAATYRQLGAPGLALGTTLGAVVNVTILRIAYDRAVAPLDRTDSVRRGFSLVVANVVMGALLFGIAASGDLVAMSVALPRPLLDLVVVGVGIPVGFVGFAVVLRELAYPGAAELLAMPGRIAARVRRRPAPPEDRGR
jgi:putative peptidoglycan lipid II flippase